jgi:hypothetical protein
MYLRKAEGEVCLCWWSLVICGWLSDAESPNANGLRAKWTHRNIARLTTFLEESLRKRVSAKDNIVEIQSV